MIRLFIFISLLLIATTSFAQVNKKLINPPKKKAPVVSAPKQQVVIKDINDIAKDLKQANTTADATAVRLKSVNSATPQTCFSAMQAAGYEMLETGRAVSKAYNMDVKQTFMDLPSKNPNMENRSQVNSRLRIVKHTFPTITFEQIIDNIRLFIARPNILFEELCKFFELNNQQIIQKGVFQYNQQFLNSVSNANQHYPNSNDIYRIIKNTNPNINHYELFVMLINGGYSADLVSNENSPFFVEQNGRTSDNASSCMENIMPVGSNSVNWFRTKMLLVLNSDGSSADPVQKRCFINLMEILKRHGLSRTNAVMILQNYMECNPSNNASCDAAKTRLINSILSEAGYTEASTR